MSHRAEPADPQSLDRRALLHLAGTGVAVVAALGLAGCTADGGDTGGDAASTTPGGDQSTGGSAGETFASPTELRSEGGRLDLVLVAAASQVPWGATTRYALTYNGTVPGPTLRVKPGDTIRLTLRNELDAPTNLHTHGLHISPSGKSDNVFVMIEPGGEHAYEYVLPDDHPSGTFWYHPHHHGAVAAQLSGGMAGVIVVEDELDDLPAMTAATERVLVLSDPVVGSDESVLQVSRMQQMLGREGDVVLVNGLLRPQLDARAGTTERWRLVNASPSRFYRLSLSSTVMHLVALDHGRLDAPMAIDDVLLSPGQRAEVLVPLEAPGTSTLRTAAVDRGGMGGMGMGGGMGQGAATGAAADLLTVTVTGGAASAPSLPAALRRFDPIDAHTVDRHRSFTLGAMGMGGGMGGGMFTIDGKSFEPGRVDTSVAIDTIEEWTITNASMMDHPFHLHVWPFRVVSRSDGAAPDPGWRDTVNVPAGATVTVRVPFHDFDGTAVYHCHILDHEDLGMMGVIEVG